MKEDEPKLEREAVREDSEEESGKGHARGKPQLSVNWLSASKNASEDCASGVKSTRQMCQTGPHRPR